MYARILGAVSGLVLLCLQACSPNTSTGIDGIIESADGPAIIISGGEYSGSWTSDDCDVPALEIRTSEPVRIVDSEISSTCAKGIFSSYKYDTDVSVSNVSFYSLAGRPSGRAPGEAIAIDTWRNVEIVSSHFSHTAGINLYRSTSHAHLSVRFNEFENIVGNCPAEDELYVRCDVVHALQVNNGVDLQHSEVVGNKFLQDYVYVVEDLVNFFNTTADESLPIMGNLFVGEVSQTQVVADSLQREYFGGGLMLGDGGIGENLRASYNTFIDIPGYGAAIAGGKNNLLEHNTIISCGSVRPPYARSLPRDVGIWVANWYDVDDFENNIAKNNNIRYLNVAGKINNFHPGELGFVNTALTGGSCNLYVHYQRWLQEVAELQKQYANQ